MESYMSFPSLTIGSLHVSTPIVQGGMGVGISLSGLASAVADAGGIGIIAAAGIGMFQPDFTSNYVEANNRALQGEIRAVRRKTDGVLGVNIMVALTNFAELVATAVKEGVDAIFSGAGLPLDLPSYLPESCKIKLVPIVSSARAAAVLCKKWLLRFGRTPDAFVVEGPMAGGHLGFKPEHLDNPAYALEQLLPEVIAGVEYFARSTGKPIPVIAAGGIFTGFDIHKYLTMGAAGVQLGTRFVCTHECDADIRFKQAYLNAKSEDLVVIKSPVGLPGRAISNAFLEAVGEGNKVPGVCHFHCLHSCDPVTAPYCITMALVNSKRGNLKRGFVFAGQNAYRVEQIVSVCELMAELEREYNSALVKEAIGN
ncbi:nitronate monooxygenase [Desulfovibrionales bacterium]